MGSQMLGKVIILTQTAVLSSVFDLHKLVRSTRQVKATFRSNLVPHAILLTLLWAEKYTLMV